jgi:hypothetical protein
MMDHIKAINADYNVRMGYWASKNNMQKYKVYAIMIWMFDPNFASFSWIYIYSQKTI